MRHFLVLPLLIPWIPAEADSVQLKTIQFVVLTPDVSSAQPQQIFLTGSANNWRPEGSPLPRVAPGVYGGSLEIPVGEALEFKFTRTGSWKTVEKGAGGDELPNRRTVVDGDSSEPVVVCFVRGWADRPPVDGRHIEISGAEKLPQLRRANSLTGDIRRHPQFRSPQLNNERDLFVYLPPQYEQQTDRRFPVLYMHDGNNVFNAATSFTGIEWSADETVERLIRAERIQPLIIVAIANNADRHYEYTPWRDDRRGAGGKGDAYLSFIAETVKPFIDKTYRTLPRPEHTGICGSSLGGLISLHALYSRPDVFHLAGIVSPALGWADNAMLTQARRHKLPTGVRIWIDVGTAEVVGRSDGRNAYLQAVRDLVGILESQGMTPGANFRFEEMAGGKHHESDWAERFDRILLYLYPK
ncbi:MAG: alpha/beta hydrolase [Planctomycetota bacterium]|jgi:predicted alpha/beta superfamily hydrolase